MKIEVFWWAGQVEDVGARAEKQQVKIMQSGPRLWRVMEAALEIAPKQLRSSWQVEIKSKVRPMAYYGRLLLQAECCVLEDEIIAVLPRAQVRRDTRAKTSFVWPKGVLPEDYDCVKTVVGSHSPSRSINQVSAPEIVNAAHVALVRQGEALLPLVHGEKILFGADQQLGVVRGADGSLTTAPIAEVGLDAVLVHDAHRDDPSMAFELSRLTDAGVLKQSPIGIFRQVEHPTYDDLARAQVAQAKAGVDGTPEGRLTALITAGDTWTID